MAQVQAFQPIFSELGTDRNPISSSLLIYTDNLMHTGPMFVNGPRSVTNGTEDSDPLPRCELEAALEETLRLGLDYQAIQFDCTTSQIQIKDVRDNRDLGTLELNDDLQVTAKIFFNEFLDTANIDCYEKHILDAISTLSAHLKVNSIHRLILSFPNITNSKNNSSAYKQSYELFEVAFIKLWTKLYSTRTANHVDSIGVADFSLDQLKSIQRINPVLLPTINQVDVSSCKVIDEGLITFCNTNGVELLAHNDSRCDSASSQNSSQSAKQLDSQVFPASTAAEYEYGSVVQSSLLSSSFLSKLKRSNYFKLVAPETSNTKLPISISPNFVLKYTAIIKNRSIVRNKGYITSLETQF